MKVFDVCKKINYMKLDEKFLKELGEYISFQSVSTDSAFLGEIEKTTFWLKNYIESAGGKVELFQKGKTNPVVFGEFSVDEKLPTVLVYGHYDVQPAKKEDGWTTENPFKIETKILPVKDKKNERLVARGIVDNKGQNFIHLFTIVKLFKQNKLKYNVKILLEGNEESGNFDLPIILKENKNKFKCDYCLVSDGEVVKDNPTMDSSLRGGGNMRITLTTGENNLHSGIFGGAVPSATNELVKVLATLKDKKNFILVKNFYKNSLVPTKAILQNNKNLGSKKDAIKMAGVKELLTLKNLDFYTQTGCLPTLEVSGIVGGYIGEGFANIVPGSAEARVNVRVTGKQKSIEVMKLIVEHIKKFTPKYATLKFELEGHGDAIILDDQSTVAVNMRPVLEKSYGKKVLNKYVGGSIPILGDFQKILKTKVISVSLGNDDCNMHGTDENFRVDLVEKALNFAETFWRG
jgi:acetylornithine deacetylase/succinyl-diaminopimelate desuccinylase-like protein